MKKEKFFTMLLAVSFVMGFALDWNTPIKTIVIGESIILLLLVIRKLLGK